MIYKITKQWPGQQLSFGAEQRKLAILSYRVRKGIDTIDELFKMRVINFSQGYHIQEMNRYAR